MTVQSVLPHTLGIVSAHIGCIPWLLFFLSFFYSPAITVPKLFVV